MRLESFIAILEEDGYAGRHRGLRRIRAVAAIGGGKIGKAVLIEIRSHDRVHADAGGQIRGGWACGKISITVIQEDTHHVAAGLCGDQVRLSCLEQRHLKNVCWNIWAAMD